MFQGEKQINWQAWGKLHFPFYMTREVLRMGKMAVFDWIQATGDTSPNSLKNFKFIVAGKAGDATSGKINKYEITVDPDELPISQVKVVDLQQVKPSYPVLNARTHKNIMAVRLPTNFIQLYKLDKLESSPTQLVTPDSQANNNPTLAWRTDQQRLLTATSSKKIHVWDVETQKSTQASPFHKKDITDLVWLNDNCFASSSNNGDICLWSTLQYKPVCCFRNKTGSVKSLCVLKQGSCKDGVILSGGLDKMVTMWDLSRKRTHQFKQHQSSIVKIQSSGVISKERTFASLDDQGKIIIHNNYSKESVYDQKSIGAVDFQVKNGFFGVAGSHSNVCVIWAPVSQSCFNKQ